jgi:hypothetical protein
MSGQLIDYPSYTPNDVPSLLQSDAAEGQATGASHGGIGNSNAAAQVLANRTAWLYGNKAALTGSASYAFTVAPALGPEFPDRVSDRVPRDPGGYRVFDPDDRKPVWGWVPADQREPVRSHAVSSLCGLRSVLLHRDRILTDQRNAIFRELLSCR